MLLCLPVQCSASRLSVMYFSAPFFLRSVTGWKSTRNSHCGRVPQKDLSSAMQDTSRKVTRVTVTSIGGPH